MFLETLYLLAPLIFAGIIHALVIKNDLLPQFKKPIDTDKLIAGKPIFGASKTWRGILVMSLSTIAGVAVQRALHVLPAFERISLVDYAAFNWLLFGVALSLGYLLAELPNSFIKRRMGVKPSEANDKLFLLQYFVDQADSTLGVAIVLLLFYELSWQNLAEVFFVGTGVHILFDQLLYKFKVKQWKSLESPFRGAIAAITQLMVWGFLFFLLRVIFRGKVKNDITLPPDRDAIFIMAANHQSGLDPFMVTAAFSPRVIFRLLPFRYMTANQFIHGWRTGWFLRPLGGFPAHSHHKYAYGLERAKFIMKKGHTLCIFPEGRRTLPRATPARSGVMVLANEPGVYIIPLLIQWTKFSFFNRKITITMGQPYRTQGHTAEQVLEDIYNLADPKEPEHPVQKGRAKSWKNKVIESAG